MPEDLPTKESVKTFETPIGQLAKQFEFLDLIDSGGMGVIYKARNLTINQIVAIKMIQASALDDRHIKRFKQEATALSNLDHYGIVHVKDFGFTDNAQPYMVLEWIDGLTLPEFIKKQRRLSLETLRSIFVQIAEALSHAHERGVMHRDLKPSNIMIKVAADRTPCVKVIDFGIAKMLTADMNSALTRTGEVLGSPAYMSPEQIGGIQQDARTDVYSFGCMLFEALSGVPPFQAELPMDLIFQQLNADVPNVKTTAIESISDDLAAIVTKCLQKDPDQRFQSMDDLGATLSKVPLIAPPKDYSPAVKKSMFSASAFLMVFIAASLIYLMCERTAQVEKHEVEVANQKVALDLELHDTEIYANPNKFVQEYIRNHRNDDEMKIMDSCNDAALIEFTKGNFATKYLKLQNADVKGPGLAYLIRLPLTRLEMQRSSLTDRGLLEISKMRTLKFLTIDATKVTPLGLSYLSNLALLRLSIRDVNTNDEGLKNICKISTLEHLQLDGNPNITDEGYSHLPELKNLYLITFRNIHVSDRLIKTLLSMKSLTKAYIIDTDITDKQLEMLAQSKTIHEFHLEKNSKISAVGMKYLISMPKLNSLDLRAEKWLKDEDLKMLKRIEHKFYIDLEDTNVTDVGMKTLAETKASSIDIARTSVTDAGLMELVKAKNLKEIRINIGEILTPAGIRKFERLRPDVEFMKEMSPRSLL